jgi:diacylglycerol kinase
MGNVTKSLSKFKYAYDGLKVASQESSFRIQLMITTTVILLGIIVSISLIEWIVILLLIGMVLSAELFNTVIERICDLFSAGWLLTEIKIIKDISAGAVAVLSIIAVIVGLIIFLPKLQIL